MSNKVILHATDLDGYLNDDDKKMIEGVGALYDEYLKICNLKESSSDPVLDRQLTEKAAEIGHRLE